MDNYEKWLNFLRPETLKSNLIHCAFYIALFESFKDYLKTSVKDFYMDGFNGSRYTYSPQYAKDVLSKNKSDLYASLLWLKDSAAIDENDLLSFEKQKVLRNKMAHDMMECLVENQFEDYVDTLSELMQLRIKIEKWWILNVDIPTNSDFDGKEIGENDIQTGSEVFNKIMIDILTGKEGEADYYYNEFVKNRPN